ncbi:MAG: hydrogenase-4 component E [Alphaproteobacteria bacterium]|nr:hydrogenase-4 component E [Alphaproteobacteria bacterium]
MSPQGLFATIEYDAAHFLAALILLLSFGLLYQRRLGSLVTLFTLHALALTAAAAWQGYVQGAPQLYVTAAIALVVKGIGVPLALSRIVRQLEIHRSVETVIGVVSTMLIGVALVGLSILLVLPFHAATPGRGETLAQILPLESLTIALAVIMLGLLMMITRRNAVSQVIGFMALENGLMLAAVGAAGMPLVVELSVALSVMAAFFIFGMFFFRIRERFDSLDVHFLETFRGDHV